MGIREDILRKFANIFVEEPFFSNRLAADNVAGVAKELLDTKYNPAVGYANNITFEDYDNKLFVLSHNEYSMLYWIFKEFTLGDISEMVEINQVLKNSKNSLVLSAIPDPSFMISLPANVVKPLALGSSQSHGNVCNIIIPNTPGYKELFESAELITSIDNSGQNRVVIYNIYLPASIEKVAGGSEAKKSNNIYFYMKPKADGSLLEVPELEINWWKKHLKTY